MCATGPTYSIALNATGSLSQSQTMSLEDQSHSQFIEHFSCSRRTLEHIAADPSTPPSMLNQLASHPYEDVRLALAENPNAPLDVLYILTSDEQVDVRYGLAENTNLPIEILELLAADENPYVAARALRSIEMKEALRCSRKFTTRTANLKVITAAVETKNSNVSALKRFITTLTNLKALSAILPAKVS